MSDDDSDDEGGLADTIRTVTPLTKPHRTPEMDVIGWVIFLFLVVLALPLLPVIVVGWVLLKLFGGGSDRGGESTG